MTEMTKTLIFLGVALAALFLGVATAPSSSDLDVQSLVGETLASFNPEDAKRLKIVEFDEDTATLRDFEVAQDDNGLWTLPSKSGYPADAERQMGEAVGALLDREIMAVVSNNAADHEQYGVIDPDSPDLEAAQEGVGHRVTISDIDDEPLIDLIIGKEVKDVSNQRYVRQANRDVVYVLEVDPEKLSTNFADWIEADLLKLNMWDLRQVELNDYTAELVMSGFRPQIQWDRRGRYTLEFDDENSQWSVGSLETFDHEAREFRPAPLAEDEKLNEDKLDQLKTALDDLRIVDVERKPAGLSSNLKAGEDFMQDNEALQSLVLRGFAPVPADSGQLDLLSSEGEVIATMQDGVEYVLRFGNLQLTDGSSPTGGDTPEDEDSSESSGVHRYLFVMAQFNKDFVPQPELEELPPLPEESDEAAESDQSTDEPAPDEIATDETSDEATTDETASDEATADETEDETTDAADTADTAEAESEEASSTANEREAILAQRQRIEAANARRQQEYEAALKAGQEKVDELNLRFGDWYYVIDNDVFQKIHLSREDLTTEHENPADAAEEDVSDFGAPGSAVPGLLGLPTGEEN